MGRRRRTRAEFPLTLDRLDAKGPSGLGPKGRRWRVRAAGVGATLQVRAGKKGSADRLELLEAAPGAVEPACPLFGTCGGCQLQEMSLDAQRAAKADMVARVVDAPVTAIDGAPAAYGYRNKLELSFGARRFVPDAEVRLHGKPDREAISGTFLGFHPPGWFSRIVDAEACPLGSPAMNAAIAAVRSAAPGPAWDNRAHTGTWRHVVLREGDEGVVVTLVTTSAATRDEVGAVASKLAELQVVKGVLWRVNDGVAEVATGELREVLHGESTLPISLGGVTLELPADAFFQVNIPGTELLLARIAEALGEGGGGTLLDLYCGVGTIGMALAHRFDEIVGIELFEGSIVQARANAERLGVAGSWHVGAVEAVVPTLDLPPSLQIVVDPPRVGLHPKAAAFLADVSAEVLVYVACKPESLGRDRRLLEAGGWRLDRLWAVDLFPQTRHVEAVARFVRRG